MKTILIGPTGFLGPSFLEKDDSIIAVGRSEPVSLKNEFFYIDSDLDFKKLDKLEFDNVIFLIGSSDHHVLNSHPTLALEKNTLALSRFLWYLRDSNRDVNKIINFTTMLQYDTQKMKLPCDENQPRKPTVNNYVLSKFVSEIITDQHRDKFSIIDVRISNVYGPTKLIRPDIVPSLIWSILSKSKGSVWTKKPERDFIFVEDAIDAVLKLLHSDYSGPVNLGSGIASSVKNLCEILEKISGVKVDDQKLEVAGHMKYYQDITLIKKLINWEPQYSLDEGLTKTFNTMKEYYKEPSVKEYINQNL
jgi:nucleoside-diphosphate-sugar epimerase